MRKGHLIGKGVDDPCRHGDIFSECAHAAEQRRGDSDDLAMIAEVDLATTAVEAVSAIDRGVKGDTIAHAKVGDILSNGFDNTGSLVPHDDRRDAPARASIEAVHIASADAAGF